MRSLRLLTALALLTALSAPALRAQASVFYNLTSPTPEVNGLFGYAMAALTDQDGDGMADLAVVAGIDGGGLGGRVYVFSGADGTLLYTLTSPSGDPRGGFGLTVAGTGGSFHDVLVGAQNEDVGAAVGAGRVYVFRDGALRFTLTSPTIETDPEYFGSAVADAGDANGDGTHDYLIGAPGSLGAFGGAEPRVYVFSGATGALLRTITSPAPVRGFGNAVASVGDLNGVGAPELLVGSPFEEVDGASQVGRAFLFDGDSGAVLATLDSPGPEENGVFGATVTGLGRFGMDPAPYFAVGAWGEDGGAGRVHVYQGAGATLRHTLDSPDPELSKGAFSFGWAMAGLGDPGGAASGTGGEAPLALIIGAPHEDGGGQEDAGRAYLFRLDGTLAETLEPQAPEVGGFFGCAVAGLGDVDGNGDLELAVGAFLEDGAGVENSGRATVWTFAEPVPNEPGAGGPAALALHAPVPNPARGVARIVFTLDAPGPVRLAVYDALGREVAVLVDAEVGAGRHEAVLDRTGLPAGVYLVRLDAGGGVLTRLLTRLH